jgi:flagella basal body P-ring formation protein FlgA
MKRSCAILLLTVAAMLPGSSPAFGATLFEAVTQQFTARYHLDTLTSRVEILSSQLDDTTVAPETVRIKPLFQKEPIGLVSIVVEIAASDKSIRHGQISLRVRRYAEVYVASDDFRLHEPISDSKLSRKTMDVTSLREQPVTSLDNIQGYRTKRNLSSGQIVTTEAIESVPDIEVGREVSILCTGASFTITAHGRAMQTGRSGELIRVRNASSGKVIVARVVGANEVTIEM